MYSLTDQSRNVGRTCFLGGTAYSKTTISHRYQLMYLVRFVSFCIWIYKDNGLTEIRADVWDGLQPLEYLTVKKNEITSIPQGTLADLPKLKNLNLSNNHITTLNQDIFTHEDSLDEDRPEIELSLKGNPLICDDSSCWLKKAEQGRIWFFFDYQAPNCVNTNTARKNINLNCE